MTPDAHYDTSWAGVSTCESYTNFKKELRFIKDLVRLNSAQINTDWAIQRKLKSKTLNSCSALTHPSPSFRHPT